MSISPVNKVYIETADVDGVEVKVVKYQDLAGEAELDEMWSFVQNKGNQRRLWLAIDHKTHAVLAYTFGRRQDRVFKKLKDLPEPFGITMFFTDDWGSYERNIEPEKHTTTKKNPGRQNVKILR